jgi:hypothetical protein
MISSVYNVIIASYKNLNLHRLDVFYILQLYKSNQIMKYLLSLVSLLFVSCLSDTEKHLILIIQFKMKKNCRLYCGKLIAQKKQHRFVLCN